MMMDTKPNRLRSRPEMQVRSAEEVVGTHVAGITLPSGSDSRTPRIRTLRDAPDTPPPRVRRPEELARDALGGDHVLAVPTCMRDGEEHARHVTTRAPRSRADPFRRTPTLGIVNQVRPAFEHQAVPDRRVRRVSGIRDQPTKSGS
jgi:hypothetical protein